MARGPTAQAGVLDTAAATNNANAQNIYGTLEPQYQSLATNGGYTQPVQNAIIGQGVQAANAPFASASDQATETAARTGNRAGLNSTLDNMAREKSSADANATQAGQIAIANDAQQQQQLGRTGLQNLFGTSQQTMDALYGSASPLFNVKVPSTGALGNAIQGAGQGLQTALLA